MVDFGTGKVDFALGRSLVLEVARFPWRRPRYTHCRKVRIFSFNRRLGSATFRPSPVTLHYSWWHPTPRYRQSEPPVPHSWKAKSTPSYGWTQYPIFFKRSQLHTIDKRPSFRHKKTTERTPHQGWIPISTFSKGHNSKQFILAVYDQQCRVSKFSNYVLCFPNYVDIFVNRLWSSVT